MGFETGNILERAMGVGNFFGMLPLHETGEQPFVWCGTGFHHRQNCAEAVSAAQKSKVAGFETTDRRDFYDLAVGNVPFRQLQSVSDKPV